MEEGQQEESGEKFQATKKRPEASFLLENLVGHAGFEPATLATP